MKTILVLEDHSDTRAWIIGFSKLIFPQAIFLEAATLEQAYRLCETLPDFVLTDLSLPDGLGHELIAHIKKRDENIRCIVITSFEEDDYLFPALQAGADGYLLKDQTEDELVELLEGIFNGKPPMSPAIAFRLFDYFRQAHTDVKYADAVSLTEREKETLQLISKGYSTKECAHLMSISHYTVSGYIKDIYQKLQISSRAEAAREAQRLGLN